MKATNSLEQFSEAYRYGKVIFFAGSGISYDAGLPKADHILDRSIHAALPTLHLTSDKRVRQIQPEVFYETLLSVNNTIDVLGLWRSLHAETQNRYAIRCHPNNVHLALVEYSAKHAIPILTTNFDTMFEEAAKNQALDPLVLLPEHDPPTQHYPGRPVVCKLHGSIADSQGNLTLPILKTTMTQISTINTTWLEYIFELIEDRSLHICFVGYSGRDIDLFPQIRKACLQPTTKAPFWINHFKGDPSDEASLECCAIRIEDYYPSAVFNKLGVPYAQQPPVDLGNMLHTLSEELKTKLSFTTETQQLIYGLLLTKLGHHKDSYALIKQLYDDGIRFPYKQYALLSVTYARLNHEVGHYEDTHQVAGAALAWSKNLSEKYIRLNTSIQARCWKSEARRMYVPVDTYFSCTRKIIIYFYTAKAVVSFITSGFLSLYDLRFREENFRDLDVETRHELIEHAIRLLSMFQGWVGSLSTDRGVVQGRLVPLSGWRALVVTPIVNILVRVWDRLGRLSLHYGYAVGVGNAAKFSSRLKKDAESIYTQDRFYDLLTWSTGIDLSLRNKAEADVDCGQYPEALKKYEVIIKNAEKSGCRLTEIKGILGIANANKAQHVSPWLSDQQLARFDELIKHIQGPLWKDHFDCVRKQCIEL